LLNVTFVGIVVIIGVMTVLMVILLRRGRLQPVHRALSTVSVRYSKNLYAMRAQDRRVSYIQETTYSFDNMQR